MKAVGVLILLAAASLSSTLPKVSLPMSSSSARSPRASWEGLAIVVNRNNPTSNVSLPQLRAIYVGDRKWWSSRRRIALVSMQRNTPEWQTALRVIYKMDSRELDRYFLYQSFKGEHFAGPTTLAAAAEVRKFVVSTPGAVGYLRASDVDDSVKVLRVNGLLPGDDGYPLRLRVRRPK